MIRLSFPYKHIVFALSLIFSIFLTVQTVQSLSLLTGSIDPHIYLGRVALCLAGFLLPIIGAWISFHLIGGIIFSAYAGMNVLFASTVSQSFIYLWFLVEFLLICYFLFRLDYAFEDSETGFRIDREKNQNERNDLEVDYKVKGEGISIFFEKYSTYYHLRKMAEELVTSFSVSELSNMVVQRCTEFIPKEGCALMSLSGSDGKLLSVLASKKSDAKYKIDMKEGDMFDVWVIRNRKRLIVTDSLQDFRFDVGLASRQTGIRSLIIVPLLHEGRVIGTLRFHASEPNVFSNDDLRLLDAIGTLASSALSNAMLFEKTEELAIRDSLTGLYVRRYFFQRLKQEHRRFLITQRPLSLIMFDLDYFKKCNDRFGHEAGDLMLVRFSEILKYKLKGYLVARYGGEEFAVILMETNRQAAFKIAEQIRQKVEKEEFSIRRKTIKMTVSCGVASMPDDTLDTHMLIQKADQALYKAKREGRNRVCLNED